MPINIMMGILFYTLLCIKIKDDFSIEQYLFYRPYGRRENDYRPFTGQANG